MRVGLDDFKVLHVAVDTWVWFILDLEWLDPPILYICIYNTCSMRSALHERSETGTLVSHTWKHVL